MRKLGQHFLKNKSKLQEIVEALDLKPEETVIEIGPGHGELTGFLVLAEKSKIIAIEKDRKFVQLLKKKFENGKNLEIIQGDALRVIPKLKIKNYKIVGNIPYYITGYLLRILGELENKPSLIVLTIQKEVAERICAQPPRMNLLAASVQFWAEPKIVDYISKKDFWPIPKVDSAVIKLNPITLFGRSSIKCNKDYYEEKYYKLIKILFKQPRKTILNNLKSPVYAKPACRTGRASTGRQKEEIIKILEALKINPVDRPQNLTLDQIKKLTSLFELSCLKQE